MVLECFFVSAGSQLEKGDMSSGGPRYFQSKASILKRDDGVVVKSKKVHFARSQHSSSPVLHRLKSRLHEMDASMVSKSWSTSRRRQHMKEMVEEGDGESDSGVPQSNLLEPEAEECEFEVESILDHKVEVCLRSDCIAGIIYEVFKPLSPTCKG